MITLTNGEALAFFSPMVNGIFTNPEYKWPVIPGHLLQVSVEKIQKEFKQFIKDNDAILSKYGTIGTDGSVAYETPEDLEAATNDLNELRSIRRDVRIDLVKVTPDFPQLTMAEIRLLRPLLDFGGDDE